MTEKVTLVMSRKDYENLLVAVWIAAGVAHNDPDKKTFLDWLDFAARLVQGGRQGFGALEDLMRSR